MSNELTAVRSGVRSALAIGGLISVVVGIAILVWPTKSATVLAAILGVYTIVAGLSYIGVGLSSLEKSGWGRVGHILLGVLYIIAGVVFFGNLQATTAILIVLITIMIGAIWIVEGVTAFTDGEVHQCGGAEELIAGGQIEGDGVVLHAQHP